MSSPSLRELLATSPFLAYAYSYPHKTAYRTLSPPRALADLWRDERRSALFLYVHIPFCEQRCGFCNLYTQVEPQAAVVARYLDALERQARVVAATLAPLHIARMAIGGGTPTWLAAAELDRVFGIAARLGAEHVPTSVETSPQTADDARLEVLQKWRVSRVSIGVQSLFADETAAVGRHQTIDMVRAAIERMTRAAFVTRNIDLMYGLPGQTAERLLESIERVIEWGANELYLYPLYVRPLTRLGRRQAPVVDERLVLYRRARQHLLERGWTQRSMRMFCAPTSAAPLAAPNYRCQADGMIGLGAGARSYTCALHYAAPFATAQATIRDQVSAWCDQTDADFGVVTHGVELSDEEQRRRFIILSLLERGLHDEEYHALFGARPATDLPQLAEAVALGLVDRAAERWTLTARGLESADVLGQWLSSPMMLERMAAWSPA